MFLGSWWKKGNFPSKKHEIRYNYSICLYLDAYWAIFSDIQCTLCIVFASCDVFCNCTVSLLVISGSSLHSSNTLARPSNTCNGRLAKLVASNKTQFNTLMLLSEHLIWGMAWISNANNNAIKMIEKMHVMYRYLSLFQQRLSNDTMETCSEVRVCISSIVWKTSNHGLQIQCRGHGTKGTENYPSWNIVLFYCNLCIVLTRFSSSWICPEMVAGAALLPEDSNSISNVFPKNWGLVCLGPALVSNQSFEISKELSFAFSWQCHRVLLLSNVECMKNT